LDQILESEALSSSSNELGNQFEKVENEKE
jgi:hypothetical protein